MGRYDNVAMYDAIRLFPHHLDVLTLRKEEIHRPAFLVYVKGAGLPLSLV